MAEIEAPIQALQTAGERRRVADGDDHLATQSVGEPGDGKHRKGVLEQSSFLEQPPHSENAPIATHASGVFQRTKRFKFRQSVVFKLDGISERVQVIALILLANIGIPMFGGGTEHTRTMSNIQRFTDVRNTRMGGDHFPHPGRPRSVCAGYQDGLLGIFKDSVVTRHNFYR